jgi:outer membrane protein assembly factor BamE (lipoprotein component of BamABCDE complex)
MSVLRSSFALALLLMAACASAPPDDDIRKEVPQEVHDRWQQDGNYYALLELVEAYVEPGVSKEVVRRHLGEGATDPDDYPNAGPNYWVYFSSRRVMEPHILIVEFDDRGLVKDAGWV